MRIYFVGSHATGKTTMTRYVSRRYGLPMITEVARAVLAELETALDALRTDMDLGRRVPAARVRAPGAGRELHDGTASSPTAPSTTSPTPPSTRSCSPTMHQRPTSYKRLHGVGGARASSSSCARTSDLLKEDGVRAGVTWESVLRIDGMIKLMLEQRRIPYLPIESVAMQERARAVDFVLKRTAGLAQVAPAETVAPKVVSMLARSSALGRAAAAESRRPPPTTGLPVRRKPVEHVRARS